MQKLPKLNPGDTVEIIAPASRCSDKNLSELKELLLSWHLNVIINDDIFGSDLLCANTDDIRFHSLKNALLNPASKAVICARGGYGSARLITELNKISPPTLQKLFIGMSDATVLNLFLQQQWNWSVLHGALAPDRFSQESIAAVKSIMFNEIAQVTFDGLPLNSSAEKNNILETTMTGGNLCILQTSIGTIWQVDSKNKLLFIEEVGERGYRIDRMLEHLHQAGIFNGVAAIIVGDFLGGEEPNGSSLITPVLERFAHSCDFPVIKIEGVGHGNKNFPLPLGTNAQLRLGKKIELICAL